MAAVANAAERAALKSAFLITLRDRGFLFQFTALAALDSLDSLHVGSLLQIMVLQHLQKLGHRSIVLVGGGSDTLSNPTGEGDRRILLDDAVLQRNTDGISKVFQTLLPFDEDEEDAPGPQQRLALVHLVP